MCDPKLHTFHPHANLSSSILYGAQSAGRCHAPPGGSREPGGDAIHHYVRCLVASVLGTAILPSVAL
eukprot:7128130-Prymnesium_polylepis.1